ncbi:hypothetical protein imdm_685 [gamma proteobacterium IMCC2047]|nr:hypothetical protein imdm_685 [gamma proteobacterium IMCC2047]
MINDSRINPRVPLSVSIKVDLPDGRTIQLQSQNISLSGLMLVADQKQFEALLHRKNSSGVNIQPELHATFNLPRSKHKDLLVDTRCRAIHVRRESQNKYYVGVKFLQLNQAAVSAIQQHVTNNL